jgi:hypothetical protein
MFHFQLRTLFLLVACAALMALGWRIADSLVEEDGLFAYHLPLAIGAMVVVLTHGSWRVVPMAMLGAAIGATMFLVPVFQLPYHMTDEDRLMAGYVIASAGCSVGAVLGSAYLCYRDRKQPPPGRWRIATAVPWLCLLMSVTTTGTHLRHWLLLIQAVME